jgi:hypothetical protein
MVPEPSNVDTGPTSSTAVHPVRGSGRDEPGARIAWVSDMVENAVKYLRSVGIFFRLTSYPAPEPAPAVAHLVRPAGIMIDTHLVIADGRVGLVCVPRGETISLPRLRAETGTAIVDETTIEDLPWPYNRASGPIPPLGGLLGVTMFVDPMVAQAAIVGFNVFSTTDFIELGYDDFARVERPRMVSVAGGEQLPPPSVH